MKKYHLLAGVALFSAGWMSGRIFPATGGSPAIPDSSRGPVAVVPRPLPGRSAAAPATEKPAVAERGALTTAQILERLEIFKKKSKWEDGDYEGFGALLVALAAQDPEKACELLAAGIGYEVHDWKTEMFAVMMKNFDAARMTPLLEQLAKGMERNREGYETCQAMAEALAGLGGATTYDPVLAILFASGKGEALISNFFNESAQHDGMKALEAIGRFGLTERRKEEALLAVAFVTASVDPEASLRMLQAMDPGFPGSAYGRLMSQWLMKDPKRAAEVFAGLDARQLQGAFRDPELMAQLALPGNRQLLEMSISNLPPNAANAEAFQKLAGALFTQDRMQAMVLLDELPEGPLRSDLIRDLWAKAALDGAEAAGVIAGLPEGARLDASRGVVERLSAQDVEGAARFIYGSPVEMQSPLLAQMIGRVTQQSPTDAAALFSEQLRSGRLKEAEGSAVVSNLSLSYGNYSLSEAQGWISKLPSGVQPEAFAGLMMGWSTSDPVAASEWLSHVPAGANRDAAARVLANELRASDPKRAEEWLRTLAP